MPTTPGAIRDAMLALVVAITPATHAGQKFVAYREQLPGHRTWSNANPASCLRRVSVDNDGSQAPPTVVSSDTIETSETFTVTVSYPIDSRHGVKPITSVKDLIESDRNQIQHALHVANSPAGATVIALGDEIEWTEGDPVAFGVIRYRVDYYRTRQA